MNVTERAIQIIKDPEASADAKAFAEEVLMERERFFPTPSLNWGSPMMYGPRGTEIPLRHEVGWR